MHATPQNPVEAMVRRQWHYAVGCFALGVAFLAVFAMVGHARLQGWLGLLPVGSGLCLLAFAVHEFRDVQRRTHGMRVETRAIADAAKILPAYGIGMTPNVRVRGRGDIDMVVGAGTHHMPVEIKSYESWEMQDRERRLATLEQVARAQRYLRARRGYVWLPEAKAGMWRRWRGLREGDVTVVFGSARHLARIIRRQEG